MARSHDTDEIEAEIETIETAIAAIEDLQSEIEESETIGETRLSKLFHKARTTSKGHWQSVSAFCQIEDGEVVVDHLDKLSDGRWNPETRERYDVIIKIGIEPFMTTDMFRRKVDSQINQELRGRQESIRHRQDQIARMEVGR